MAPIMDAPPVQYVTTSDGYNIAYAVSGRGRPLVLIPQLFSHIHLYWHEDTFVRPWLTRLAERFQLVQYDGRGQGMSTRGLPRSYTIEDAVHDLEAVIEAANLSKFAILAFDGTGHIAARYAAENPQLVEALVLVATRLDNSTIALTMNFELARQN
jgi:pimeloyl-ACP methyl ester carboxylesterase